MIKTSKKIVKKKTAKKAVKKKVVKKKVIKKKATQKKRGCKPKIISDKVLEHIEIGAESGLNEEEIAKSIGWAYSTYNRHKANYPEENEKISEAISRGREKGQNKNIKIVENSLLRKCKWQEYEETTVERRGELGKDGKFNSNGKFVQKKTKKMFVPSDGAISLFLTNKAPEDWKSPNKIEVNNNLPKDSAIENLENLTDKELLQLKAIKQKLG